jgi:hypothetical protein
MSKKHDNTQRGNNKSKISEILKALKEKFPFGFTIAVYFIKLVIPILIRWLLDAVFSAN